MLFQVDRVPPVSSRQRAIRALGHVGMRGHAQLLDVLFLRLRDKAPEIRAATAEALSRLVVAESARACSYYSSKQVQITLASVLAVQVWLLRVF